MSIFRHLFVAALAPLALIATPAAEGAPETWYWLVDDFAVCNADLDADCNVDVNDLVHVIIDWGTDGSANNGDVNGDGTVNVDDLVLVITKWGPCP